MSRPRSPAETGPRAVLFDLDGTIADTLCTIGMAVNDALRSLGLPQHSIPAYAAMVGDGVAVLCQRALPPQQAHRHGELVREVVRHYTAHPLRETRVYPGMEQLLGDLRQRGARLAVLSNKPHDLTVKTLEGLGLDGCFEAALGEQPGLPRKPDPAGVHRILTAMEIDPSRALYVGDTATDMWTAAAAHLTKVGVLWGFRNREELEASGADHLVTQPAEILPLFESWALQGL